MTKPFILNIHHMKYWSMALQMRTNSTLQSSKSKFLMFDSRFFTTLNAFDIASIDWLTTVSDAPSSSRIY